MSDSATSGSPVDVAFALLGEGRAADAEELMKQEVQRAAQEHGEFSAPWAYAQCDMGNVLLSAGQPAWAVECFRAAAAVTPGDDPREREDQLSYRLDLGVALALGGRLDEAADVLRANCADRLDHYGRDHAEYAYALEPLADVLLRLKDISSARIAIDEALRVFWSNGHERVVAAVALRGVILHADGEEGPLFPGLPDLPEQLVVLVAQIATARVRQMEDPDSAYLLVAHLANALRERLGPDHQSTLNAFGALADLGRDRGDHSGRTASMRRVIAAYDRQNRSEEALLAALELAHALSDAKEPEASLRTYEEAAARARKLARPDLASEVLRNWGLALQDAGYLEPAAQRLAEAVSEARRGGDPEKLGRAAIAHGILLAHRHHPDEARATLEEGLPELDPTDRTSIAGRRHLVALLDGHDCGCDDLTAAVEDAYRDFVLTRLPAGLLTRFDVKIVGQDFDLDVELGREPTPDELRHLDETVRAAHTEFRHRVPSAG